MNRHTLQYTAPQIMSTVKATTAIMNSTTKNASLIVDNHGDPFMSTPPAYEADE